MAKKRPVSLALELFVPFKTVGIHFILYEGAPHYSKRIPNPHEWLQLPSDKRKVLHEWKITVIVRLLYVARFCQSKYLTSSLNIWLIYKRVDRLFEIFWFKGKNNCGLRTLRDGSCLNYCVVRPRIDQNTWLSDVIGSANSFPGTLFVRWDW